MTVNTGEDLGIFRGTRLSDGGIQFTRAEPDRCVVQVPWLSQLGEGADYAPGDCGPACLAMVLYWMGKPVTVDMVSQATGKPAGFKLVSVGEMVATALKWDVTLQWRRFMVLDDLIAEVKAGRPCIALVNYPSLPIKSDASYASGHFLVVVGASGEKIIYHDPYWRSQSGAFIECPRPDFDRAWGNNHLNGNSDRQAFRIAVAKVG